MTKKLIKLRQIYAQRETTFNTDPTGTAAAGFRIEAQDINFAPAQDFLDRPVQMDVLGVAPGIIGGKGGKMSFKMGARGPSTIGISTIPANLSGGFEEILVACCMRQVSQIGKLTASDQASEMDPTTSLKLASGAGLAGHYGKGNTGGAPVAAVKGGGTALQVRLIPDSSTSGDTLALAPPLDNAASLTNAETVWGGEIFYPDPDASVEKYCTIVGAGDGYYYLATGCRGRITKISADASKRVMFDIEMEVTTWTRTDSAALAGEILSQLAISDVKALASPFHWSNTGASKPVVGVEFDPGMTVTPVASTEAADGKAGFLLTGLKPMLKVKPYFDGVVWQDGFGAGGIKQAIVQFGNTPGHTVTILIPYGQISKFPGETDSSGVITQDVEIMATVNTGSGESAASTLAPFYLCFH